jgi:L-aminopeptidase/D-esterase-like protein
VIDGVSLGHRTDDVAGTGCSVIIFPEGTVASGEVRGGAPATRDVALLEPTRTVARVDAVCLSGGSVFGLAAVDGVIRWCDEQGRGFPTGAGPVPIVIGLSLFDLVGRADRDPAVRPTRDDGYAACRAATSVEAPTGGRVGAGTGATTAKHRGREHAAPGGFGTAVRTEQGLTVVAAVAVNAYGSVVGAGEVPPIEQGRVARPAGTTEEAFTNTTIGVVVTDASLTKAECFLVAQSAHDGYARALDPPHTRFDGDAVVAAATRTVPRTSEGQLEVVRSLAVAVTAEAIRNAVLA